MSDTTTIRRLEPEERLFRQGDSADGAYLVLNGSVTIVETVNGTRTVLATLHEGEAFGEMALFDHGTRSADAVACDGGATVRFVSIDEFETLLGDPFLRELVREMAQRLRVADEAIGRFAAADSARRGYLDRMSLRRDWAA